MSISKLVSGTATVNITPPQFIRIGRKVLTLSHDVSPERLVAMVVAVFVDGVRPIRSLFAIQTVLSIAPEAARSGSSVKTSLVRMRLATAASAVNQTRWRPDAILHDAPVCVN